MINYESNTQNFTLGTCSVHEQGALATESAITQLIPTSVMKALCSGPDRYTYCSSEVSPAQPNESQLAG
jgi:hypothetical protein